MIGWKKQFHWAHICLTTMLSLVFVADLSAQGDNDNTEPFQRQIFVPFDSLEVLLDGNSNRVLLTRTEYDELLKSARKREIKRAPFDSAIVSANYQGTVADGVAMITGELIVEPLNEGLIQIPLPFSGVAIRNARLGDQPAKLWRSELGQIVLLTAGEERETLTVEMTVPMQTSAARQSMTLQLPSPSATRFNLTVPGNVEVKSGVSVANRKFDEPSNTTAFDLLASRKPMNIVMSLNNRSLKDDQVIVSRSVLIHKLTPYLQEMHLTCSLDVIHGALEEIEFAVPNGFQVSQVTTELLSQWEMKEPGADSEERRLLVKLRQPTRDDVVLNITAARTNGARGQWQAQDIRPVDVAGHVSVVGVLADVELQMSKLASTGVIPIDHEFLLAALPGTLQGSKTGSPVTVVAAFYAPQTDYSISANFTVPAPKLIVKSSSRLVIDYQRLELQGGLALISQNDSRFGFKISLPKNWRLNELTDINNQPVKFDRLEAVDSSEFLVQLPTRISPDSATKIFFKISTTPEGWLEKWKSRQIEFPLITIDGQTQHTGAIAVSTDEDLVIKPIQVSELELLDEEDKRKFDLDRGNAPLAYQFTNSDYELTVELERLEPAIIARTYNFFAVKPSQLDVHAELVFEVKQASEGEFRFELPNGGPKSISVRTKDQQLKDYRSEETESGRQWILQLAKPVKGTVHLLVDYQMPLDEAKLAELKLSPAVVKDVGFQTAMVAIEGSSELDIEISTKARAVDVGELSEAVRQPGRYTLGAYSWPSEELSLDLNCQRRPVYELPSAIVQRAEMVTSISTSGKAQSAARFQMVTKQQPFLRIKLPPESTLWSVRLDGKTAKPQRQNDALLISLIGNEQGKLRDLQLVFESPASSFNLIGNITAEAPTLWLNETGEANDDPVPLVDLHWRLIMPDGFSVSHSDGNFQSDQLEKQPSPIEQLGYWIYQLGGGIGQFGVVSQLQATILTEGKDANLAAPSSAQDVTAMKRPDSETLTEGDDPFGQLDDKPAPKSPANSGRGRETRESETRKPIGRTAVDSAKSGEEVRFWALSGLRSLDIKLTDTGNSIGFYNLGDQPTLQATVVNQSRINWMAITLALLIAALGVMLTRGKFKSKIFFLLLIVLVAGLVPLAGATFDAFKTVIDLAILTAVFLAIYFVVAALIIMASKSVTMIGARLPLMLCLFALSVGYASQSNAQEIVNDAEQLKRLILDLQTEANVELPNDAIIIPFDPEDPDGREKAERLLIPYEHYLGLINRVKLDLLPKLDSPVGFVLSSAEYQTQLSLEDDIAIQGKLVIELLTDDPVAVALPFSGGALAEAKVDGKPAKLQFGAVEQPTPKKKKRKKAKQQRAVADASVVQLYLEGRGTKVFEFTLRMKPVRQGGWRMINARMPVGLTRGLNLTSLPEATEIRLNSDADRRSVEAEPNEEIATVLSADGTLRLQWKPSTATQSIDQSLTADSEVIFDVREDGLRLTWQVNLDFRGSERDVFTLNLPDGFLVEQVTGENIRSWDVKEAEDENRLNVALLSPAKDKETFAIELSRRDFSVGEDATQFDAPYVSVGGAALQKGIYRIRRSPIIELKTTRQQATNRIDAGQFQSRIDLAALDTKSSPLGIESFQDLRFVTTPFRIGLQANLIPRTFNAETQSILRIGQSEAGLEMRANIKVGQRPIYKMSFDVPVDTEIRQLSAGLNEKWTSEETENKKRIHLFFPAGISEDFSILLDAEITDYVGGDRWEIPSIEFNDAEKQTGFVAIQVDPAINVTTGDLENCETVLLQQVESWLNSNQRTATRLALRTRGSKYQATLKFSPIKPRVTVETVTNVRTTLFAIEETILLDFNIQQAGIREVQFELPASLRSARIVAKLVSEIDIADVEDNADVVRVTLTLQDDVIDSYRVVIENDRQLSDERQDVPIPRAITGVTEQRYATLQNAGRDEIEVLPSTGFRPLNRQLKQFSRLKQKLAGGELTMAYVSTEGVEWPVLQFESNRRAVFDTVAASIEFAKTTMVVDTSGAYRALQNFQVNNRSEQYLEIELPSGAKLLTVVVEGQPVKPVAWPAAKNQRRLRIPLVKTSLGDLDYSVQLKYAGRLGDLSNFHEIEFPVIESLNINVQLSQLHLRLPETYRWMNFSGTMTRVDSRGELEESFLSYKSRQIQQLAEQIQSKSSSLGLYSKSRAFKNLSQLEAEMKRYESEWQSQSGPRKPVASQLNSLIQGNNDAILRAQQNYSLDIAQSGKAIVDNRANFNQLVEDQSARFARNSVVRDSRREGGQNFFRIIKPQQQSAAGQSEQNDEMEVNQQQAQAGSPLQSVKPSTATGKDDFDGEWLKRNKLGVELQERNLQTLVETKQYQPPPKIVNGIKRKWDDSIGYINPSEKSEMLGKELEELSRDSTSANQSARGFGQGGLGGGGLGGGGGGVGGGGGAGGGGIDRQAGGEVRGQGRFKALNELSMGYGEDDDSGLAAAALTSLDIELPARGADFFFKSPRGKAKVTVRPLKTRSVTRWSSAIAIAAVCLGIWIVCWFVLWLNRLTAARVLITMLLLLIGLLSLISSVLPFYGLLAVASAVVLFVDWLANSFWRNEATESA